MAAFLGGASRSSHLFPYAGSNVPAPYGPLAVGVEAAAVGVARQDRIDGDEAGDGHEDSAQIPIRTFAERRSWQLKPVRIASSRSIGTSWPEIRTASERPGVGNRSCSGYQSRVGSVGEETGSSGRGL